MPKQMLAATPPRRMSRSSTRKLTDSLSSCSTTRESANLPRNVIRWSVAIDAAIRRAPDTCRNTTRRYRLEYPSVVPSVGSMTDAQHVTGLAYDDPSTPSDLSADCRAAEARLSSAPGFDTVARAAARPAPSIRFEDFPREIPKPEIHPAV